MSESRFQRWSRRKQEARTEAVVAEEQVAAATAVPQEEELSPEEKALAENEALPEEEVLAKYDLPDPEKIELGTDIKGFMSKEIPEALRRKALRSLWKSNPVLAVLDGLNDYDEDFTMAASGTDAVRTLYKVGQGFLDRTKEKEEQESGVAEALDEQVSEPETQGFQNTEKEVDAGTHVSNSKDSTAEQIAAADRDAPDHNAVEESLPESDLKVEEDVPTELPKFRPRMSFR